MSNKDVQNHNITDSVFENNHDTDILTQISSYNYLEVQSYIATLKRQLMEQKKLNEILKDQNYTKNIKDIESFSEDYKGIIEKQRMELNNIKNQLKKSVEDNNKLKDEKEEFNDICQSPEYTNLAKKIRDIKTSCIEIKHFLEDAGILNP
jgi:uncharacterized coiled-coil DUF342 family protein